MKSKRIPIKIQKRVHLENCLLEMRDKRVKRNRVNPTHRWTETETKLLLAAIVDEVLINGPQCFEKPTAMRFYEKVTANVPEIKGLAKWSVCKSKMRHLKQIYVQAHAWQKRTGAGLLAEGNHKAVTDYIQRYCPFWELLDKIFGANTSEHDDPLLVVLREDEEEDEELIEIDEEEEADDSDSELNRSADEPDFNTFKNQFKQQAPTAAATPKAATKPATASSTTTFSSNSGSIAVLVAMQEKKLLFEETKWQQQQECEVQKLAIEREKCKLRKLELRQQHEIKRLEIERDERLAMAKMKMESESEERIKKYELELRVKSDLY